MYASRIRGLLFMLVSACFLLGGLEPSGASAQEDGPQVTWDQYDVTIQVNEDGTLRVTESILIEFHDSFRQGTRDIPMDRIEAIDDVEVFVGTGPGDRRASEDVGETYSGEPYTYRVEQDDGDFVIDYGFPRTSTDSSDTFRVVDISYTAHGSIRNYPEASPPEQQVRWTAISSDMTQTGSVRSGSATIIFPEEVSADELAIDPAPTTVEDDRVTWEASNLSDGESLMIAVAFPTVTDAVAPAWQANADMYEDRQEHLPALNLIVGLVAAVGGAIMILFMIVRGVRDPEVGLVADLIPHRPDDLEPPLVGTLVDESVDTKDVIAGLLDLDRQGFVTIREGRPTKKGKPDYRIELNRPIEDAPAWGSPMLAGIFGQSASVGKDVDMRKTLQKLREKSMSDLSRAYEDELFARGYFVERPHTTRMRWLGMLVLFAVIGALLIGGIAFWAEYVSGWAFVPGAILLITLVVGGIMTTKAAVKTTRGAVVAAKWKAYGRYLEDLRKGPDVHVFFSILETDLPWAVALGFDSSWAEMADDMSASNTDNRRRRHHQSPILVGGMGSGSSSSPSTAPEGTGGGGGLQSASGRALAAISGGSAGMFAMLNDAAASFNAGASSGSSSSGGFSGSSTIGSSGGGGHSFS